MADHNATDAVSRRNVLKATGGLLAGATLLAGQGTALAVESLRFEVEEVTEEYIAVAVRFSEEILDGDGWPFDLTDEILLGHAERFVIHEDEDAVSLPENPEEVLANPAEVERLDEETYRMYFRTRDIHWPKEYEGGEVELGLGVFSERTVPQEQWYAVACIHKPPW